MTVIVWDGKTLASDRMTTSNGVQQKTRKLLKHNGHLYGFAGDCYVIQEMVQWILKGCDPANFPERQWDPERCASVLMITPDARVMQFEHAPYPLQFEEKKFAMGSGRQAAMAALLMGATAEEAVEIASKVQGGFCGHGVDTLTLDQEAA